MPKRKRRVLLCRRTEGVKVGGKVIPSSFLKVEGRGTLVGAKDRKERDRLKNWQVIKTQVLKHLPGAGKNKRERRKENVRLEATARKAMEKGRCVRVIEGEKVRGNDPMEYFLAAGVGSTY